MDTYLSFIPHEHHLVGVDDVNDFSDHFPSSFLFHLVGVVCLCGR
jgi:hypothetical protein